MKVTITEKNTLLIRSQTKEGGALRQNKNVFLIFLTIFLLFN